MGHGCPAARTHAKPVAKGARQVGPLRVVGPRDVLDVVQSRLVLDVQEPPLVEVPGKDSGAAGELEVLVRLVDRYPQAKPREVRGLALAHRGVDDIPGASECAPRRRAIGLEPQIRAQSERASDPNVGLERHGSAGLDGVCGSDRHARTPGQFAKGPSTVESGGSKLDSCASGHPRQGGVGGRCGSNRIRHSTRIEQGRPYRAVTSPREVPDRPSDGHGVRESSRFPVPRRRRPREWHRLVQPAWNSDASQTKRARPEAGPSLFCDERRASCPELPVAAPSRGSRSRWAGHRVVRRTRCRGHRR